VYQRSNLSKNKYIKTPLKQGNKQINTILEKCNHPNGEISKISVINTNNEENLITSTSKEPLIIQEKPFGNITSNPHIFPHIDIQKYQRAFSTPDTYWGDHPRPLYNNGRSVRDDRHTEGLGLTGFILTLIAWVLVYTAPLCILGIIFGAVSIHKIRRYPEKYKGKGLAITSLILGIVGLVVGSIAIAILL
jgi:hypothetical protein